MYFKSKQQNAFTHSVTNEACNLHACDIFQSNLYLVTNTVEYQHSTFKDS